MRVGKNGALIQPKLWMICWLIAGFPTSEAAEHPPGERGIVLEEVASGSALEKAGLRPGDVLVSWERSSQPPVAPDPTRGRIDSAFDWIWLTFEEAPRGPIRLAGLRQDQAIVFEVAPQSWDTSWKRSWYAGWSKTWAGWESLARPRMSERMTEAYLHGKTLTEKGMIRAGIDSWLELTQTDRWREDPQLRCWLYLRIGQAWSLAEEFENADAAFRSARQEARTPHSETVILDAIGDDFYYRRRDIERAQQFFQESLNRREQTWGRSLVSAKSLIDLGRMSLRRSDHRSAESYYERALKIWRAAAPEHLTVSMLWFSLGQAAFSRDDLDRAGAAYQSGLDLATERAIDGRMVTSHLSGLAHVALKRHELDRAAGYFRQSLKQAGRLFDHGWVGRSLHGLGWIASLRENWNESQGYFLQNLKLQRKMARGSVNEAEAWSDLGVLAFRRGHFGEAEEYFQKALVIQQNVAPERLEAANSLGWLGQVAFKKGELAKAEKYFNRDLKIRTLRAPGSLDQARSQFHLATLHLEEDRPKEAISAFRDAIEVLEAQVGKLGGSHEIKTAFRARNGFFYDALSRLLLAEGQPEEAFFILERSRARTFLEMLAERHLIPADDAPREFRKNLLHLAAAYDRILFRLDRLDGDQDREEVDASFNELVELRLQRESLIEKLRRASPRYSSLHYPQPLGFTGAREILDPGTVLLSYSVGADATSLFVIVRDEPLAAHTLPFGEAQLSHYVALLQDDTHRPGWSRRSASRVALAKFLYRILLRPAEESIAKGRRLLIIPDGPLRRLPFSALIHESRIDGRPAWQYLVEWKPVHSVLSATVYAELLKLRRPSGQGGGRPAATLAAFGDPAYPQKVLRQDAETRDVRVRSALHRGYFDWQPLDYSRQEIERIARLYPAARVRTYFGKQATEERVKSLGSDTRILHIASHGYYDERSPLDSALALTIPETFSEDRDNGLLQAWEIFESVRLDADLVVLSACETAVGREQGAEGLIGLTRAFQYAGARTVAATLWKVNDQTTAELMVRFYRHLRAGMHKDEALRAAQIELIRGPIRVRNDNGHIVEKDASAPYYWAPFQLYGDWQ